MSGYSFGYLGREDHVILPDHFSDPCLLYAQQALDSMRSECSNATPSIDILDQDSVIYGSMLVLTRELYSGDISTLFEQYPAVRGWVYRVYQSEGGISLLTYILEQVRERMERVKKT